MNDLLNECPQCGITAYDKEMDICYSCSFYMHEPLITSELTYNQFDLLTHEVKDSYNKAIQKHKEKFHSYHEGYGILLEELNELWDEIKKQQQNKDNLREEAIQCIVVLRRFILELL